MQQLTALCKVCGKPFIPCVVCVKESGRFSWREVTCSLECGCEYFKMIAESRQQNAKQDNKDNNTQTIKGDS